MRVVSYIDVIREVALGLNFFEVFPSHSCMFFVIT